MDSAVTAFSSDISTLAPSTYPAVPVGGVVDYVSGELSTSYNYYAPPPQTFCYNTPSGHLVPAAAFQPVLPSGNFVLQPAVPMPFDACVNEMALPHMWTPNPEFVALEMAEGNALDAEEHAESNSSSSVASIAHERENMLSQKTMMAATAVATP